MSSTTIPLDMMIGFLIALSTIVVVLIIALIVQARGYEKQILSLECHTDKLADEVGAVTASRDHARTRLLDEIAKNSQLIESIAIMVENDWVISQDSGGYLVKSLLTIDELKGFGDTPMNALRNAVQNEIRNAAQAVS